MTINLENQLIKENKKLLTPKELLLINEYEKHTALSENDALARIGLNKQIREGEKIKNITCKRKEEASKYNKDRVFHVSQIEAICKKYHLRFLNTKHYKGSVDKLLPEKITTFEVAYNKELCEDTAYIMAPASSFDLQSEPKDPLFFYQINDEYYYLIHKWGNDLNILRILLPFLSSKLGSWLIISFFLPLYLLLIPNKVGLIIYITYVFISSLVIGLSNMFDDPGIRLSRKNDWNSEIE